MKSKLGKLTRLIQQQFGNTTDSAALSALAARYWDVAASETITKRSAAELLDIVQSHLSLAESRRADNPKIQISPPNDSGVLVFEMVAKDQPFIFDTLSSLIYDAGYTVLLSNHPIFWVSRDKRGQLLDIVALDRKQQQHTDYRAESFVRYELEGGPSAISPNRLKQRIRKALSTIALIVTHWQPMREKAKSLQQYYSQSPAPMKARARRQVCNFLSWLTDNNLTFLAYVEMQVRQQDGNSSLHAVESSRLGLKLESTPWEHIESPQQRQQILEHYLHSPRVLTITKSSELAPIRRFVPMDYIAIKDYNAKGELVGEHRFYGLMTRAAYNSRALDIPLLADRIHAAMNFAHFPPGSHNGKVMLQILETFPRDELFQSTAKKLFEIAMGLIAIEEQNRVRVFSRTDPFHRYYSILVYIPREQYSQQVREKIQILIAAKLNADSSDFSIYFTDNRMARLHLIVQVGTDETKNLDNTALEELIFGVTESWQEKLKSVLYSSYPRKTAQQLFQCYIEAFTAPYIAKTNIKKAAADIEQLEQLKNSDNNLAVKIYRDTSHSDERVELRCYFKDQPLALSEIQPRLSNLGLRLMLEDLYPVSVDNNETYWVQDFRAQTAVDVNHLFWHDASHFEQAFIAIHKELCDDDDFNRLIISADINWREVSLIRAYCRYLKQLGNYFEQNYLSKLLVDNGAISRLLIDLFHARFNPNATERDALQSKLNEQLDIALEAVQSLDTDRLCRSLRTLIMATLRSNYYQTEDEQAENSAIYAFKFSTRDILEAPAPRPRYEIWVHSPNFEAVHLRGDKVARGGLRWSDRPEDFRTEVLGLVKAQMVKNAVIVPVGAKGGFVCRRLPENGSREIIQAEVIRCYKDFIRAMLSLTDNLQGDRVIHPRLSVCHDDDDPYLVVAADKGTAAFSDIANGVSNDRGFWIGDAFASGGSNGYDHKKMGITAKGGWEAVKRHFREQNKDIQREEFTTIGIGDMAGDVFGNGMLLSKKTALLAAFNHLHIFLDPTPNTEESWKERKRLFKLPRSNWSDYNKALLSAGGDIYSRALKSITPSAQACQALALEHRAYTPDELIHHILQAPVDLLWNGGIGTYVKAEGETHQQAGDRANDNLRVNGAQLRCKAIGEGGNLGLTQAGRIEYALNGGRCNSDFIDNSAGVDSSDNEVNIKILLNELVAKQTMRFVDRNKLLKSMTKDVERQVLRSNYLQTQSISMVASQSPERLGEQAELIRILERDAGLDRKLESLPDEKTIQSRRTAGLGLTRPELACLLSYSKIHIKKILLDSTIPEDPYLAQELYRYFPSQLGEAYPNEIGEHRLRREIICTVITNSLVNRMGNAFAHRLNDELGNNFEDIARAYTVARDLFDIRSLWADIEKLDNKVPDELQTRMMLEIRRLIKHVTLWLINNKEQLNNIQILISRYAEDIKLLADDIHHYLSKDELRRIEHRIAEYCNSGIPRRVAQRVVMLKALFASPDITWLKERTGAPAKVLSEIYFRLAESLQITWVRRHIDKLTAESRWHALARNALRDDLYQRHRELCAKVADDIDISAHIATELDNWLNNNSVQTAYLSNLITEVKSTQQANYLSLSVILRQLGRLSA
ncbi:glutamate dehydrogenase [Zhongshania antarctica]|uniref:Glutamate dehydrogenase n=1 Tax=Zhongshania antarctica TaxID=641702 RepID=A0A840R0L4_9GAMM|nr:NAD-glutamate dehydrogenase [Zhongshania antarctica]MBB5186257.1 glutamate dehydrogenase [Zhongshania antarctica]